MSGRRYRSGDVAGRRKPVVKTLGSDPRSGVGSFYQTPPFSTPVGTIAAAFLGCWIIGVILATGIPRIVNICDPSKCVAEVGCPGGVPAGYTEACQLQAAACTCSGGIPPAGQIYPDWQSSIGHIALFMASTYFAVSTVVGWFAPDADFDFAQTLPRWIMAWWNRDEPLQSWTRLLMIVAQFAGYIAGLLTAWPLQPTSAGGDRRTAYFDGGYALGGPDVAYDANPGTDSGSTEAGIFWLVIFLVYGFKVFGYLAARHQFFSSSETSSSYGSNTPGDGVGAPRSESTFNPAMHLSHFGMNGVVWVSDLVIYYFAGAIVGPLGIWTRDLATFTLLWFPTAAGGRFPGILYVAYLVLPVAGIVLATALMMGLMAMTYGPTAKSHEELR